MPTNVYFDSIVELMQTLTQTDSDTQLSRLEEQAVELSRELNRVQTQIADILYRENHAQRSSRSAPQIYLPPLRPYDRLRAKWNLGTGLDIPESPETVATPASGSPSAYLRLFGLLADGSPWECRIPFEEMALRGSITLGRDPESADIAIPDAGISRTHVQIALSEQGLEVTDMNSTNGTAINGQPFSPYQPAMLLQSGDTLTMGDVILQAEINKNTL